MIQFIMSPPALFAGHHLRAFMITWRDTHAPLDCISHHCMTTTSEYGTVTVSAKCCATSPPHDRFPQSQSTYVHFDTVTAKVMSCDVQQYTTSR